MFKFYDLNRTFYWTGWQLAVFKLCVYSFGIILGAYFADFFRNYYWLLGTICLATSIPVIRWWMQSEPKEVKASPTV